MSEASSDERATRLPIVGVMGSGSHEHRSRATPLGRLLASLGVHLLTGGGLGVMTSVSRAFVETRPRTGLSLGVLPGTPDGKGPRQGYPNPWVELPIRTHLPLSGLEGEGPQSRNSINVLTSDFLVVMPGGAGTASEARLAVRFGRPAIAFLRSRDEVEGLPDEIEIVGEIAGVEAALRAFLGRLDNP